MRNLFRRTSAAGVLLVLLGSGVACTGSGDDSGAVTEEGVDAGDQASTGDVGTEATPPPEAKVGDEICGVLGQEMVAEIIGRPVDAIEPFNRGCRYTYRIDGEAGVVSVMGVSGGPLPTEAAFDALLANYAEINPDEEQKPLDIGARTVEFTSTDGRAALVLTDAGLMFEVRVPSSASDSLEPLAEAVVTNFG